MEINDKGAQDSQSLVKSRLAPVLLFGHSNDTDHGEFGGKFLYSIPSRRQLTAAPRFGDIIGHYSWITPRGWVLTLQPAGWRDADAPAEAFLRDPFSSRTVRLPPPDQEISGLAAKALAGGDDDAAWCVLSNDPADPCCVVVVVHPTEPALFYCRPGGARWLRHEYQPEAIAAPANHDDDGDIDDRATVIISMRSLTASGGKLYTDLPRYDKMVTLEFSPSPEPEPTLASSPLSRVPCSAWCNFWYSCLVDSCGELFIVHFRHSLLCDRRILIVHVHRLDPTRGAWVKADRLGSNRVFLVFTGPFGVSMAADEAGLEPNCIYFSKSDDKGLHVYDLGQGTTALYNPGEDIPDSMEPILLMPVSTTMEAASSTTTSPEWRDWSSLPVDLLLLILEQLRWSSHPRVAAVCRHWRSAVPPSYPAWITPLLLNAADVGTTNVRYYIPYFHKNFVVDQTLTDPGAKLCCPSAAKRLKTLSSPEDLVLDADLISSNVHELPSLPSRSSPNFVVYDSASQTMYAIHTVGSLCISRSVLQGDDGDGEWDDWDLVDNPDEQTIPTLPISNPVFHNGFLYLLGKDGRLALYDPSNHDRGFDILDKPDSFGFESDDSYLVESDQGELMAILVGRRGTPVHVLKLDEETMEWEKVESLQGRTLFTGTLTTLMKNVEINWMQNKVFLPKLYNWPETVDVDLVFRDGELAFVPKCNNSGTVGNDGDACEGKMWY